MILTWSSLVTCSFHSIRTQHPHLQRISPSSTRRALLAGMRPQKSRACTRCNGETTATRNRFRWSNHDGFQRSLTGEISTELKSLDDTNERLSTRFVRCKIVANWFKADSRDDDDYSGSTMDNFEPKYILFLKSCDQADIPDEGRNHAFSTMLIGNAHQYYVDSPKRRSST